MQDTALRALTGPASLSKDASVSNEHLQEIAREAHVNSLFDGRYTAASLPLPLGSGFAVAVAAAVSCVLFN
jgi:hypothetical protein